MREATEQSGRTYLQVADRAAIADLDRRATPTSLIVVRLGSARAEQPLSSISDLFLAVDVGWVQDRLKELAAG